MVILELVTTSNALLLVLTRYLGYKKENCDHDPAWCFSNAVGKTLPHTFFSYQSLQSLITSGQESDVQSSKRSTSILSLPRARDLPPLSKERMRQKDKYNRFSRSISLAQERISEDVQMPPLPEILGNADHPNADLPIGAVHPHALAPSVYRSPPVPMTQSQVYAFNKAKAIGPMVDEDGKPVTPQGHRFAAIQRRREARRCLQAPSSLCFVQISTRLAPREEQTGSSPEERITQRGYSDGFLTAKMFAQQGPAMSRLGFKAQYMKDTVTQLKGTGAIGDGDESKYAEWFWKGLSDGEGSVEKVIAAMTSPA
jgi:glucan 1,3-beta-glucosidase